LPRTARAERPSRKSELRLTRTAVWIIVVGGLLAGIVALNVAALELRMERGRLQSEIIEIRAENAELESQISAASALSRIEAAARALGLVEPVSTTYVQLERRRP
jgi:cell division protein FtsL